MEQIGNLIPEELLRRASAAMSYDEYIQKKVDIANNARGHLKGYDCPICKNKGFIFTLVDGYETAVDCKCRRIRRTNQLIEQSCLTDEISRLTFDTFRIEEPHADMKKRIFDTAKRFIADKTTPAGFFIGGQSGAGKTHICTAIVGQLLRRCVPVIYMSWLEEARDLKAKVNDCKAYSKAINRYKTIDVLYIDDFLKTGGNKAPSSADITLAFEIINYRTRRQGLQTIISSEFHLNEIIDMDQALGSRITAMSKSYHMNIAHDGTRNYRLTE